MWSFTCFYCYLSKSSGCSFACVIITDLIRMGWISKSHYCYFGKHCIWFFKLCHSSLSNSSECNFPCVATTHLISSGWISIFCHCYFTNQLMWFSTFCRCCFCCHCTLHKHWFQFSTCCNCSLNSIMRYVFDTRSIGSRCSFSNVTAVLLDRGFSFPFLLLLFKQWMIF